jgi:Raf kinase inhibitor-like YbhB/YbcL family protein
MGKNAVIFSLAVSLLMVLAGCAPAPDAPEEPTQVPESLQEIPIAPTTSSLPQSEEADDNQEGELPMEMSLTSPAFNDGEAIPILYSCDGEDLSPDLDWFGIPEGTETLVLIMDDPDAPGGTWVHWVLYNIPADMPGLQQGITGVGVDGINSWNRTGYGGPCPPSGTHRYFFKLYALDIRLDLDTGADKQTLLDTMESHILGQAELMGTFTR